MNKRKAVTSWSRRPTEKGGASREGNRKGNSKLVERMKRVDIKPFGYRLYVIHTNDIFASAVKRGIIDMPENAYACHCGINGIPVSLMFLPHDAGVRTIAHEVSHCTWHIFSVIGALHENEVMAYMNGYLTAEVLKFTNGTKRRKKRTT